MKNYRNIGQIVLFVGIFALFVLVVRDFIIPVILGLLISLVFRPVYRWILRHTGQRGRLSAIISTLLLLLCVLLPLILIGTFVFKDAGNLIGRASEFSQQTSGESGKLMQTEAGNKLYQAIRPIYPISPQEFEQRAQRILTSATDAGKNIGRAVAGSVPRAVTSMIFFLIAFYFGLVDGPRFAGFLEQNSPFSNRETGEISRMVFMICNAVVLGALLAAIIQGTIIGIAYWILGIPKPLLFAAITMVFGLIPLVGSAPTGIGGAIYLLATGQPVKAIVMMAAFGIAAVSDNIVKPMVLKGRTALHPLLGLISVLGGLKAFGVGGIFLGPVVTASTIVFIKLFAHRLKTMKEQSPSE